MMDTNDPDDPHGLNRPPYINGRQYKVGYKKPPREFQWKPGETGNKRGRPRKKKIDTPHESIWHELMQEVEILDAKGEPQRLTMMQAFGKRVVQEAVKGNKKCMDYVRAISKDMLETKMRVDGPVGGVLLVGMAGEPTPEGKAKGLTLLQEIEEQQAPYRSKTVVPPEPKK